MPSMEKVPQTRLLGRNLDAVAVCGGREAALLALDGGGSAGAGQSLMVGPSPLLSCIGVGGRRCGQPPVGAVVAAGERGRCSWQGWDTS